MNDRPEEIISIKDWLITLLLLCIPIVNIVMLILWIKDKNNPKRSFAIAQLIVIGILITVFIGGCSATINIAGTSFKYNTDDTFISISETQEDEDSNYAVLGDDLTLSYITEVCQSAQEDFENLGLDPEEDYTYWMSIKQMIDPESNNFLEALAMGDLDYLNNNKTTFDGIMNVISEYDYVNKDTQERLKEKVQNIYDAIEPHIVAYNEGVSESGETMKGI